MESNKEKDVSIEVRSGSFPTDTKGNEVSLAEVENDDGYQYIQIKNSETLNNTKGLETDNANDEILFKKLNETENSTAKDIEETQDPESSINNVNESENVEEENNNNNENENEFNVYNKKAKSHRNINRHDDFHRIENNYIYKNNYNNKSNNNNDYQNINVNSYLRDNSDRLNDH